MIEDTRGIQFSSLVKFMSTLGYEYAPEQNHTFVRGEYESQNRVGFHTAVKWHNLDGLSDICTVTGNVEEYLAGRKHATNVYIAKAFGLRTTDFICAFESRLVERVKLQKSKSGEITVQSHIVKYLK